MPLLMFVMFSLASILGTNPSQRDVPPVKAAPLGGSFAVVVTGSVVDASSNRALAAPAALALLAVHLERRGPELEA